jgi:hypothetical protein
MDGKYVGLTVNERLYVSGLIDKFEKAVIDRNKYEIISILKMVDIKDEDTINNILESLKL